MALKVLDTSFKDRADERYVLPLVIRYARQLNAQMINLSTQQAEAIHAVADFSAGCCSTVKKRIYQCFPAGPDSPLAGRWPELKEFSIIAMATWLFPDRGATIILSAGVLPAAKNP